ncbi:MAG: sigma-54-dependent transcriptional regulator, partial [Candidatus Dormibacteraceae bacterium]
RVRNALEDLLRTWGYTVEAAADGDKGWEKIVSFSPAVVLSDLRMPGLSGMELLKQTRDLNRSIYFVMLTGHGSIQHAVEATRLGAFNFLEKPVDPRRLQIELRNCFERHDTERQLEAAQRKLRDLGALAKLAGRSKKMQEVMSIITMVAPSSASVLITGESGTGKEIAARTIHELSPRRGNAFVAVNCAAIPETLIESELFGHEKGAFTGALQTRQGCFELAQGGTLLLDEIGDMPPTAQVKLLRVLEDSKVRRVGARSEMKVDVRVLASTNKEPDDAIKSGQMRSDLFYRLNVVRIAMPPLREHPEDVEDLVAAILRELSRKHKRAVQGVDRDVLELFGKYQWPGNVRELRNTLERAVIICPGDTISVKDLPPSLRGDRENSSDGAARIQAGLSLAEVERQLILETLRFTSNKTRAAEILGITVRTLHNKLKEYGMTQSADQARSAES